MKKLIYGFILVGVCGISYFLIESLTKRQDFDVPINVIQANHHYLYPSDETFDIYSYFTAFAPLLTEKEAYASVYLMDPTSAFKVAIELQDIAYSHKEAYNSSDYYVYVFTFNLPRIDYGYQLSEAYLQYTLKNGENGQVRIGQFSVDNAEKTSLLDVRSIQMISSKQSEILEVEYTFFNPYSSEVYLSLAAHLRHTMALSTTHLPPGESTVILSINKNDLAVFGIALSLSHDYLEQSFVWNHGYFLLYRDYEMLQNLPR